MQNTQPYLDHSNNEKSSNVKSMYIFLAPKTDTYTWKLATETSSKPVTYTMNPIFCTYDLFSYIKAEFSFIPGTIDLELVFLNPDKPVRANKRDEYNKRQQ